VAEEAREDAPDTVLGYYQKRTPMDTQTHVVLADHQYGDHDQRAIACAVNVAEEAGPDCIWLDGDVLDCGRLSNFRDRQVHIRLKKELQFAFQHFEELRRRFPGARIIYKPGNHDFRIPLQLLTGNAYEFGDLEEMSLPRLLHLADYGIEYAEGRSLIGRGRISIKHGSRFGMHPAINELRDEGRSGSSGHAHKTQTYVSTFPGQRPTVWMNIGCLCNLSPSYAKWDAKNLHHNHGLGVITINGAIQGFENVVIHRGKCLFRGKVVTV